MLEVGGSIPSPPTNGCLRSPHPVRGVRPSAAAPTLTPNPFARLTLGVLQMLRRVLSAVALTGLVLVAASGAVSANAPVTVFRAELTGDQEVPPTGSAGTGTLMLKLTDNGTRLHFRLKADGVSRITQSHIHIGAPGTIGPVVVFFFAPTPNTADKAVTGDDFEVAGVRTAADFNLPAGVTFADFLANLKDGGTYVNIHSPTFPGGEIRGQIKPVGDSEED
jgi:hypothetical protein